MTKTHTIEVIVGIHTNSDVAKMAHEANGKGVVIGGNTADVMPEIRRRNPQEVRVSGGLVGHCVGSIIRQSLDMPSVQTVWVDLDRIRLSGTDLADCATFSILDTRLTRLQSALGQSFEHPKLKILPAIKVSRG